MLTRTTVATALSVGGLLLATSACGGSSYALADGTEVPSWADGVVSAAEESSPTGKLGPDQILGTLYGGSVACEIPPSTHAGAYSQALDAEFCANIGPWLDKHAPGLFGAGSGFQPPPTPEPVVVSWGQPARHSSGMVITVAAPVATGETLSEDDSGVDTVSQGDKMVTVQVTALNETGHTVEHPGFTETRTDLGEAVSWMSDEEAPTTMLAGDTATWTEQISVDPAAQELRLEWATGSLPGGQTAYEGLHFRGPLPWAK